MTKNTFDPLQQAERAIDENDYPALVEAAAQIGALIRHHRYLAEPLLVIGQKLAERKDYLLPAFRAAEIVNDCTPSGSELKQQAVDTWAKCADALHEEMHAEIPRTPTPQDAQRFVEKFNLKL